MSLETIFSSMEPTQPGVERTALVLMGGGARTAYQAGVLRALAALLGLQGGANSGAQARARGSFPFNILVGTSAGALNAAFLASRASQGLPAFDQLAGFWATLRRHGYAQAGLPLR